MQKSFQLFQLVGIRIQQRQSSSSTFRTNFLSRLPSIHKNSSIKILGALSTFRYSKSYCSSTSSSTIGSFNINAQLNPLPVPKLEETLVDINTNINMVATPSDDKAVSQYILPLTQPVVTLDCEVAFNGLTPKEKLYAHYLSKAAWFGGLVVPVQTSPESPVIVSLLLDMFTSNGVEGLKVIAMNKCGFTEDEWKALIVYTSGVFANAGNYKGFGDTKLIPGTPVDKIQALVSNAKFNCSTPEKVQEKWDYVKDRLHSLTPREKQLGLGEKGITTYFSLNCTTEDAALINKFMKKQGVEAWMTRVFKTMEGAVPHYEIRSPSAVTDKIIPEVHDFEGAKISFTRADYAPLMEQLCYYLGKAQEHASNETEVKMLECYIKAFSEGSLDAHKDGSRFWIKNKGPAIETYIGFIENYRDPDGLRSEFEGLVSMVNRPMSKKFQVLVDRAQQFLPILPWGAGFEKDKFLKPDFTSLDVLTFSGSGIPAGINIPNYDEIRQNEGFKNVSLGNVIPASYKDTNIDFLSEADKELLNKYRIESFEVQVALHELLGHGSGKILEKKQDGTTNFSADLKNPLTGQVIESMYHPGETYDSVFNTISSSYEECRAECIGIFLSLEQEALKIFGHEGQEAEDVKYVNWLSMVYNGAAKTLEMYQPDTKAWMQAHSQARFVILQVLIEAGEGLIHIEEKVDADGKPDLLITLDRTKIDTVGREAIKNFLLKLQVYKSTADIKAARTMFDKYSQVHSEGKYPWTTWREIVMERKKPRKQFVQPNTIVEGTTVVLKNYDPSPEGLIESWVERFSGTEKAVHAGLDYCWEKDKPYFN